MNDDEKEFQKALRDYLDTFGEGPPLLMMEHFENITDAIKEAVRTTKRIKVGCLKLPPGSLI